LLETQMREQIVKSIERASATLTPDPNALGVTEMTIAAGNGKSDAIADEVVALASRFGGSSTKGLQDKGRITVLVDLPPNREQEFRAGIQSFGGEKSPSSAFAEATSDKTLPTTARTPRITQKKRSVV